MFFLLPAITAAVAFFAFSTPVSALQTIPYKMNFQGKLADSSGVPLANGTYNMKFRIYDASTAGTLQWSEQRAVSAGTGVTVTNGGLFSVQLGDVASLPVSIFTNQNLYFEVELPTPATATCSTASCGSYTEGAMAPRNKLGSSAYAFNSDTLDGMDSTAFAAATGSAGYIQNGTSRQTANFNISGTGTAATLQASKLDTSAAGTLTLGGTNATSITIADSATVSAGLSLTLAGGATGTRPASPSEGMMYYDTTTKQLLTYSNGKWQADSKTATVVVAAGSSSQSAKDGAQYVGNGTNDDVAINAAIASLPAGGGTVYLMGGTYTIASEIIVNKNYTMLTGEASALLQRGFTGGSDNGVVHISSGYSELRGIEIDGVNGTYGATTNHNVYIQDESNYVWAPRIISNWIHDAGGQGIYAPAGVQVDAAVIEGNHIENNGGDGMWLYYTTGSHITDNTVRTNASNGIDLGANSVEDTISGNTVNDNGGDGVAVNGRYTTITNNISDGNGAAASGSGFAILNWDNTLSGNTASSNDTIGIYVAGSQTTLTGNTTEGNHCAIWVNGADTGDNKNITITGNTISFPAAEAILVSGITTAGNKDMLISSNNIIGYDNSALGSAGIQLNASAAISGVQITDNKLSNEGGSGYAINIGDSAISGTYLSGNVFIGSGANGVNDSGTGTIYANQLDASGNLINKGIGSMTIGTSTVNATLSLQGGLATVQLAAPSAPTITNAGTAGTTSYSYAVTALDGTGETLASTVGSTTTGNSTLSATNYNTITFTEVSGAISYKIYRTASSGTPSTTGYIGTVTAGAASTNTFNDTGIAATGSVPSGNTTGGATIAGAIMGASSLTLGTSSATNGVMVLNNNTNANKVTIQSGATASSFTLTLPTALGASGSCLKDTTGAGALGFGNCISGGVSRTVTLVPEFAGGVLKASGSNNLGTMTSDYDSTARHNYYSWISSQTILNSYDIVARNQIPSEYTSGLGNFKVWVYAASSSTANNDIKVTVRDGSGTACASSVSILPGTAATWTQQSVALSGCSFAANDVLTIDLQVLSLSSNEVRVGEVSYQYTN